MTTFFTLLALLAPLALLLLLWVLAQLSQRLGAVTKRPPRYRLFYLAAAALGLSLLARLWSLSKIPADLHSTHPLSLLALFPLLFGLLLALATAWYYWSWLIYTRE